MEAIKTLEDIEGLRPDDFVEIHFTDINHRGIVRNQEAGIFFSKSPQGLSVIQLLPEMDEKVRKIDYEWDSKRETFSARADSDHRFAEQDYERYKTLLYQLEAEQLRLDSQGFYK